MMNHEPKVILLCGKIASGKTHYAAALREREKAVILSCDALTFALFDGNLGDAHDTMSKRIWQYLYARSLDLLAVGVSVILDWGFWTKADRMAACAFYKSHGIPCELHYVDTPTDVHRQFLAERNRAVQAGEAADSYYVDEGLWAKCEAAFEIPEPDEIDVRYENRPS
ncbi:MAG: ATP-binding protein [Oscillospiraceae bacterium]|nr:ATP-binding protein [Oscillospiraceae bacterium]